MYKNKILSEDQKLTEASNNFESLPLSESSKSKSNEMSYNFDNERNALEFVSKTFEDKGPSILVEAGKTQYIYTNNPVIEGLENIEKAHTLSIRTKQILLETGEMIGFLSNNVDKNMIIDTLDRFNKVINIAKEEFIKINDFLVQNIESREYQPHDVVHRSDDRDFIKTLNEESTNFFEKINIFETPTSLAQTSNEEIEVRDSILDNKSINILEEEMNTPILSETHSLDRDMIFE